MPAAFSTATRDDRRTGRDEPGRGRPPVLERRDDHPVGDPPEHPRPTRPSSRRRRRCRRPRSRRSAARGGSRDRAGRARGAGCRRRSLTGPPYDRRDALASPHRTSRPRRPARASSAPTRRRSARAGTPGPSRPTWSCASGVPTQRPASPCRASPGGPSGCRSRLRARGRTTTWSSTYAPVPGRLSPFALPGVDKLLNTTEYVVHHEDVRRAQPGWEPRALPRQGPGRVLGGGPHPRPRRVPLQRRGRRAAPVRRAAFVGHRLARASRWPR